MSLGLPIVMNITGWPVLIAGGGVVAARRAGVLLDAGAIVTVVSPEFAEEFPEVRRIVGRYAPHLLDGVRIALAATNDSIVNDAVVRDARSRNILSCRADESSEPADFVLPALGRQGPASFAVSAGSAALSATIRDGLLARWDARWTKMAELMLTLRPLMRDEMQLSPETRAGLFRLLATDEAMDVLDYEGRDGVMRWIEQKLTPYPGP